MSGQFLAELREMYAAFAYQPVLEEPPHHVAVQVDFLAYLRLKEAFARSRGDDEQAAVTAAAAQRLLEDHLSVIAEPLTLSLAASEIPYLALAAAGLLERVGPARPTVPATVDLLPVVSPDCCEFDEDGDPRQPRAEALRS